MHSTPSLSGGTSSLTRWCTGAAPGKTRRPARFYALRKLDGVLFRSSNGPAPAVDFRAAFLRGQDADRGLYLPISIPRPEPEEIAAFAMPPFHEIALGVLSKFPGGVLPAVDIAL